MTFNENNINRRRNGQFGEKNLTDPGQLDLGEEFEIPKHLEFSARRLAPHASDEELRELAEQLSAAEAEIVGSTEPYSDIPGGYKGSRYRVSMKTGEVSKALRGHIKDAQRAGLISPDLKFSVSVRNGNAITVRVAYEPRLWTVGYGRGSKKTYLPNKEAGYIKSLLTEIDKSYNYNRSDAQSDLFDRGHYFYVKFDNDRDEAMRGLASAQKSGVGMAEAREALQMAEERHSEEWLEKQPVDDEYLNYRFY